MRINSLQLGGAVVLLAVCGGLAAKPAPWYLWRSKIDGQMSCSQTPIGFGWEKAHGPFSDSRCEKPTVIKKYPNNSTGTARNTT